MPTTGAPADRVLRAVDDCVDEIVAFTSELIRIPTINPPGEAYEDCARAIGGRLASCGFEVEYFAAEGCPEHTRTHPRLNVVGLRRGRALRPAVHLNGHFDVVPPGDGWSVDPFAGTVRDGRVYGRRACIELMGSIEISGTVDEESGGFAGAAWLARHGRLTSERADCVIIPEPLNVDRICIGHRGVYWFEVTTRGRVGHGSMPFLGVNAIEHMGQILERMRRELLPALHGRTTTMPVVPAAARHATLNVNGITGGQPVDGIQTPCIADVCRAVFDRRFLPEEGFDATKAEIEALLAAAAADNPALRYELTDLMVVHPVRTPDGSAVVASLERSISKVLGW